MPKIIYLGARKSRLNYKNITYNDIDKKFNCDLICDMLNIDLNEYDIIIATPPCNFWSRANHKLDSEYSQKTKHLLPDILKKCCKLDKPFIIENVRNIPRFDKFGIFDIASNFGIYIYEVGRHTYFTNIFSNLNCTQTFDYNSQGIRLKKNIQGGENVEKVLNIWLSNLINH